MSNEQKSLEVKVGLFVFIGLAAIAIMAVQFGRVGQGLTYPITVEFSNASGLVKNADVQLSGAVVGHVAEKPVITNGRIGSVLVKLEILEKIKLPVKSYFLIGSSGLLGDKFVQVVPPDDFNPAKFDPNDAQAVIAAGSTIPGSQDQNGLDALTKKGGASMDKLSEDLELLKGTLNSVNTQLPKVLSNENSDNLKAAFASVKTTTDNLAAASGKIDAEMIDVKSVVESARKAMDNANQTMVTANGAASEIKAAAGDVRNVVQSAQGVLKSAQTGSGAIPMLIGNREVADNLRALIANIRRHGLLFYRDSAPAEATGNKVRER